MDCQIHSPATVEAIALYLEGHSCSGRMKWERACEYLYRPVGALVTTARIVYEVAQLEFLQLCRTIGEEHSPEYELHTRKIAEASFSIKERLKELVGYLYGLINMSHGKGMIAAARLNRQRISRLLFATTNDGYRHTIDEVKQRLMEARQKKCPVRIGNAEYPTINHLIVAEAQIPGVTTPTSTKITALISMTRSGGSNSLTKE